jgi:uncharacterized protein YjbI with pentapeptide repeats
MPGRAQDFVPRWSTDEGAQKLRHVLDAWSLGSPLDPELVGMVDGRIDLRGLTISGASQRTRFADIEITGVDLSHSELTAVTFSGCRFVDVVADGAHWRDVGLVGCRLVGCHAENAVWKECLLSTGDPDLYRDPPGPGATRFEDCTFSGTTLDDTVCNFGTFESVQFRDCTITGGQFYSSSFSRTAFSGSLDGVDFNGRPGAHAGPDTPVAELLDVSFEDARTRDLNLDHVRLAAVRWPRGRRYVVIVGQVPELLARIRDEAATVGEFESGYLSDQLEYVWPDQREYVIFTDLFAGTADPREHQLELAAERALMDAAGRSGLDVQVSRHVPSD